jgi:hypothetical protein
MNRPFLQKMLKGTLAWSVVFALSCVIALAQEAAPDAPSAPAANTAQRSDGQIEMDVVHALDASKALKKDLITAATIQGEVTLSGTVSSEASAELAESIASRVVGVAKVRNNLKIGNPQASPEAADPNAAQMAADAQPDEAAAPAPSPNDGPMEVPAPAPGQTQVQPPAQPPVRPPARPQYVPARPPAVAYEAPRGPVTIPQGTLLQLRTSESVGTKNAKEGTQVQFMVIHDVNVGGVLAIPRGATVHGVVTQSKKSGDLGGSAELALQLTSLDLGGQSYPLDTDIFKVKGPNKAGQTAGNIFGGALLGAIIGGMADRGAGAAIGAAAGAGAGGVVSSATPGPNVWIPAEALVDFHLKTPLTVQPVSPQEASRLAQGLYPGGPSLYRRSYSGYPYGYSRPVVYYAYPPVYYRPYYMVGGVYYWR